MPEPPNVPDFTFGVELEVVMPRANHGETGRTALAAHLTASGIDCRYEQYNHAARTWWKIVTDMSIGYDNAEIVAPILRGTEGLDQVRAVCRLLDEFGCRVDRRCGMHVHVGMRDRFDQRVGVFKEVLRTYHRFEPVLDQLTAPSRRGPSGGGGYCGCVRWTPEMERATNVQQLREAYGDRAKVNFAGAYWRHGTVEFRHHQGTVNGEKAANWVMLCLRLVQHAAKNTEPSRVGVAPLSRSTSVERDLARGRPLRGDEIPRFINDNRYALADMIITRVTPIQHTTRRNTASAGYAHYHQYVDNRSVSDLWRLRGGQRTHLAWDVDHGYVVVVRRSECPAVEAAPQPASSPEPTTPVVTRPATETTPVTLEGLMELLELSETERTYFTERQMELNP